MTKYLPYTNTHQTRHLRGIKHIKRMYKASLACSYHSNSQNFLALGTIRAVYVNIFRVHIGRYFIEVPLYKYAISITVYNINEVKNGIVVCNGDVNGCADDFPLYESLTFSTDILKCFILNNRFLNLNYNNGHEHNKCQSFLNYGL